MERVRKRYLQIGDTVTPLISRFPPLDLQGQPSKIEDDCLGEPAIITRIDRCTVEVRFAKTGATWVYRQDEVALAQIREL